MTMMHQERGTGRVERLWVKPGRRAAMLARDSIELAEGTGIVGNADRGGWRQVTILDAGRWSRVRAELGVDVDPVLRRANVLLSGLELAGSRGRVLRIGDARVEVRGETRPCALMDDAHPGLRAAVDADWGGGAFGVVLSGGTIRVGDHTSFETSCCGEGASGCGDGASGRGTVV